MGSYGPQWNDLKSRQDFETKLIKENLKQTYNLDVLQRKKSFKGNYKVICKIDGVVYNSIYEAVAKIKMSETNIRRNLRDPNKKNFEIIEQIRIPTKKISIAGVIYESMELVLKAGLEGATTRYQVMYKIKSQNYPDWFYLED